MKRWNFIAIRCEAGMIPSEIKTELTNDSALLNELLRHRREAIVLLNAGGLIRFCTEAVKLITGYEREELVGFLAFDFLDAENAVSARQQFEKLTRGSKNSFSSAVRIRNRSGDWIWIDLVMKNLLNAPGVDSIFVLLKNSCDGAAEERKMAQAIAAAKEEERAFIACELHDNVNQIVTATKLLVDGAMMNDDHKAELLRLCSANLQLVMNEIRSLSHTLASCHLRQLGLAFAVNDLIAGISKATRIKFQTDFQPDVLSLLTTDQQLQVYRIVQEAISNILRHASATHAEIILDRNGPSIFLVIKDNGKGFSMNKLKSGVGLSSMINRIKVLKGHFHVRSREGNGTAIQIDFPM